MNDYLECGRVFVEIPHQRPPSVYQATRAEFADIVESNHEQYLADHEPEGWATASDACRHDFYCEAAGHDLHGFLEFDDVAEAVGHFETSKGHQYLTVLRMLSELT